MIHNKEMFINVPQTSNPSIFFLTPVNRKMSSTKASACSIIKLIQIENWTGNNGRSDLQSKSFKGVNLKRTK